MEKSGAVQHDKEWNDIRRDEASKNSPLFELALMLVRLDHIASFMLEHSVRDCLRQ